MQEDIQPASITGSAVATNAFVPPSLDLDVDSLLSSA
jgi:hypothetical protein